MKKVIIILLLLSLLGAVLMGVLSGCTDNVGKFTIKTTEQLNSQDYRIAVLNDCLKEYTDVLPNAQRVHYIDCDAAKNALENHTVDCFLYDKMTVDYLYKNDSDFSIIYKGLGERHFSVAVSKRSAEFKTGLDKFIAGYKTNGTFDEMYTRWTDRNSKTLVFKEPAKPADIIRVGVYSLSKPLQYHNDNGKLDGFNIEFIKRYAKSLNAGIDFREYDNLDAAVSDANKGYVDMLLSVDGALKGNDSFVFSNDYLVLRNSGVILSARSPYATLEQVKAYDSSFFGRVSGYFNYFFIRNDTYKDILCGLRNTMFITFVSALIAWFFGVILCICRRCLIKWLNVFERVFSTVIKLIPFTTFLMLFFYVFFAKSKINIIWPCSLAIGLYFSTAISDTLHEGIDKVGRRVVRTLYALGYSRVKAYGRIVFPIGIKNSSKRLVDQHINMFKSTAVVGFFSIGDLTSYVFNGFSGSRLELMVAAIVLTVIYAIIIGLMLLFAKYLQKQYRFSRRRKTFR